MQLGMIGLGRMGGNMVERLMKAGHTCVVYDRSAESVKRLADKGATASSDLADFVKKLEKNHEISEDDQERLSNDVQKATDGTISEIDALLAAKEKEILTV